jgi:hypothetical protein
MTERQARRHLERMLETLTPGSILHLLADVIRQEGDDARRSGDQNMHRQCSIAEHALCAVGLGLDSVLPQ